MLGIFSNGREVLICEVNSDSEPILQDYFNGEDCRDRKDYDFELVEAPIYIESGNIKVNPERTLTSCIPRY